MDFFFEDRPSTSQTIPKKVHEEGQMSEDSDLPVTEEKFSGASMSKIQEQSSISLSIDDISKRAQEMVEKINLSRVNDEKMIENFQEKLIEKVKELCLLMKEHMYTVYKKNSDEMQDKLQELSEVLESCMTLNKELLEASQALAFLRQSLNINRGLED